jgi:hypothetical protein
MATPRAPIAPKTQAAGLAGVVSGAVIYLLQTYLFKGTLNPGLVSLIYVAVPGVLAFGAAYLAPHQVRPGDPASPPGTVNILEPMPSAPPPVLPPPTGGQI